MAVHFAVVRAFWWLVSRSAKLLPHLRPRGCSVFLIPGDVVVSWLLAVITIIALLSIRKRRWFTRQVAIENGPVVRTGDHAQRAHSAGAHAADAGS